MPDFRQTPAGGRRRQTRFVSLAALVVGAVAMAAATTTQAPAGAAANTAQSTGTVCEGLKPGGYIPDPATTGVRSGSALRPVNGDLNITTPGAVYENLDVHGFVNVKAPNVTIRNSRVRGGVARTSHGLIDATHAAVRNLHVEGVELVPDHPSHWLTGLMGHDYTAACVDVYRTVDGFGVFNTHDPSGRTGVTITQSFVHDLAYFSPDPNHADNRSHNDCIQIQGGAGTVIRYNRLDALYSTKAGTLNSPRRQALSAIMLNELTLNTVIHKPTGLVVEDNRINGGEIAVNGGGLSHFTPTDFLGTFWRNVFSRTQFYPTHTIDLDAAVVGADTGKGGTGNVYTDGTPITVRHNA